MYNMYRIFAVLCIIGCTLAEEKPTTPEAAVSRKLKTRQAIFHGLDHYFQPGQHVHPVVDYLHEPQVVGSAVHYIEPTVAYGTAQPAVPLVHPVGGIHTPNVHQVYSYVPTIGYGHPFSYGHHVSGIPTTSSVSPATSSVSFTPGSRQQISTVGSGSAQAGAQSALAQGTQQPGFSQDIQQSTLAQGIQQSGFAQATQQSGFDQATQQSGSQSGIETENIQAVFGQTPQQTETQQPSSSQNGQDNQQSGRYQYGFLQSGFGQQQQVGVLQTPTTQNSQISMRFQQGQEVGNAQSDSRQVGLETSQQFGSASQQFGSASQQSTSGSSQQASRTYSPSTVAGTRQSTQTSGSQAVSQQTEGISSTMAFSSPAFGYSSSSGAPGVRLIQPYNLSPSYAIHGLGFRTLQSGVASSSGAQASQDSSSGSQQSSFPSSSQQFTPMTSGFPFGAQDQAATSQSGPQASFRAGNDNSAGSGAQFNQFSASQPATVRSGAQTGSSSSAQDGQTSGGLSAFHSSFFRSGVSGQDSGSGSSQLSTATQQTPAILRMSNDFSYDGSFNYGFESENGISSSAAGSVRAVDPQHQAQVISGSYSYTAPDGTPISTNYYADETGFHAQGAHLPTPPPLPEYVARTLEVLPQQNDQVQPTVESN